MNVYQNLVMVSIVLLFLAGNGFAESSENATTPTTSVERYTLSEGAAGTGINAYTCLPKAIDVVKALRAANYLDDGTVLFVQNENSTYGDCGPLGLNANHPDQEYSDRTMVLSSHHISSNGHAWDEYVPLYAHQTSDGTITLSTYAFPHAGDVRTMIDFIENNSSYKKFIQSPPALVNPSYTFQGTDNAVISSTFKSGVAILLPGSSIHQKTDIENETQTGLVYDGMFPTTMSSGKWETMDLSSLGLTFDTILLSTINENYALNIAPVPVDGGVEYTMNTDATEVLPVDTIEITPPMPTVEITPPQTGEVPHVVVPMPYLTTVENTPAPRSIIDDIVDWFRGLFG